METTNETITKTTEVNVNTYKKFICDNAFELNKENKVDIYCFLKNKNIDKYIIQNADAIRIN